MRGVIARRRTESKLSEQARSQGGIVERRPSIPSAEETEEMGDADLGELAVFNFERGVSMKRFRYVLALMACGTGVFDRPSGGGGAGEAGNTGNTGRCRAV